MYRFTSELPKEEYDNFILNYSMAPLTQTYNWANIKSNWRHFHCGLYKDDTLVGVCLILVKKMIKGLNMFFVPRIEFFHLFPPLYFRFLIGKIARQYFTTIVCELQYFPLFSYLSGSVSEVLKEHPAK